MCAPAVTVPDADLVAQAQQGDAAAMEKLTQRYLPRIRKLAQEFSRSLKMDAADLLSAGWVGFRQAVLSFDPSRGVRLWTFASRRVRGAILDDRRDTGELRRVDVRRHLEAERVEHDLRQLLEREPLAHELAAGLGMDLDDFLCWSALRPAHAPSLDAMSFGSGGNGGGAGEPQGYQDVISCPRTRPPEEAIELDDLLRWILECVDRPKVRECLIEIASNKTFREAGAAVGLSESRVMQLLKRERKQLADCWQSIAGEDAPRWTTQGRKRSPRSPVGCAPRLRIPLPRPVPSEDMPKVLGLPQEAAPDFKEKPQEAEMEDKAADTEAGTSAEAAPEPSDDRSPRPCKTCGETYKPPAQKMWRTGLALEHCTECRNNMRRKKRRREGVSFDRSPRECEGCGCYYTPPPTGPMTPEVKRLCDICRSRVGRRVSDTRVAASMQKLLQLRALVAEGRLGDAGALEAASEILKQLTVGA